MLNEQIEEEQLISRDDDDSSDQNDILKDSTKILPSSTQLSQSKFCFYSSKVNWRVFLCICVFTMGKRDNKQILITFCQIF